MPRVAAYLNVQAIGINDKRMHLDSAAMQLHTFRFPTQIRFGAGARGALAEFAAKHDVRQPLLVTDRGLPATARQAMKGFMRHESKGRQESFRSAAMTGTARPSPEKPPICCLAA